MQIDTCTNCDPPERYYDSYLIPHIPHSQLLVSTRHLINMDPRITATLQEIATHTQNTAVATISTSEALLTLPQNLSEINRSTLDITRVLEALQKTTENHSIILLQLLQTSQSLSRTIQELHQGQRESNAQLLQTNGFIIQELQEINHNPQAVLNRVLQSNLAILEEIQSSNAE